MAQTVAYPDLTLEKFTGLDPAKNLTDFWNLMENKVSFSLGVRPTADGDLQTAYDSKRKALFRSNLHGPAAEWYDSLYRNTAWPQLRNAFINHFTDFQDKDRKRQLKK